MTNTVGENQDSPTNSNHQTQYQFSRNDINELGEEIRQMTIEAGDKLCKKLQEEKEQKDIID